MSDWIEPEAAARGAVVIVAGRGEAAAVYGRLSRRLAVDGYRSRVVAAVADAAAGTERPSGEVEADVRQSIAEAGPIPVVLVGSDTGASIAAHVAASAPADLTGVVLAGLPASEGGTPQEWEDEVDARSACPVHRGVLTTAGALTPGRLAAPATTVTAQTLASISIPALALHGEVDAISPADAAVTAYRALPHGAVVVVAGGRHDILNDVTHRSVAAEIVQFLERLRLPGAPVILRRETVNEGVDALAH